MAFGTPQQQAAAQAAALAKVKAQIAQLPTAIRDQVEIVQPQTVATLGRVRRVGMPISTMKKPTSKKPKAAKNPKAAKKPKVAKAKKPMVKKEKPAKMKNPGVAPKVKKAKRSKRSKSSNGGASPATSGQTYAPHMIQ